MPRNVLLIVGPPGSGKTTLAIDSGLPHLEREQYDSDDAYRTAAAHATAADDAHAAIVRTCPTLDEQREWEQLVRPTEVVVLDVPARECCRRIRERHRRNWRGEAAAARAWHRTRRQSATVDEPDRRTSRSW